MRGRVSGAHPLAEATGLLRTDFFMNMVFFMASNVVSGYKVAQPFGFLGLLTISGSDPASAWPGT